VDDAARRAIGTMLTRSGVPLTSLDTSIELARPLERELAAALELAWEWGAPGVRVFGGAAPVLDDIAQRLEPVLDHASELGVTVVLETHDSFARAALVGELLRLVESPSFAALWDVHHPYRVGESPHEVVAAFGDHPELAEPEVALPRELETLRGMLG
jgi:sugar phosphate isomerase/epimerase